MKPAPKYHLLPWLMVLTAVACNSPYVSKKRGYFKINFPERAYRLFDEPGIPYTFEYPVYARITQDTTYFDNNPENDYWRNIDFPELNGRLFLSYKRIGGQALYKVKQNGIYKDSLAVNVFDKLVADAFTLTNKNDVVANSIRDSLIRNPQGISGVFFRVGGNAATARQFFLTDSSKHFLRGALYFDTTPNSDSLEPVHAFLQKDLEHLINTFRWKD
jgi:gliding motility-associated lipoprotein GldD